MIDKCCVNGKCRVDAWYVSGRRQIGTWQKKIGTSISGEHMATKGDEEDKIENSIYISILSSLRGQFFQGESLISHP
jgi:hypothetical protein